MDATRPILYLCQRSGLANRLRALCGYQALARLTNVPFLLYWEANSDCDAQFSELFEMDINIQLVSAAKKDDLLARNEASVFEARSNYDRIWEVNLAGQVSWDMFRDIALNFLRGLRPLPEIGDQIRAYSTDHNIESTIGLHVRMTDNLAAYQNWVLSGDGFDPQRISTLEGFEQFISDQLTVNPEQRFFLATDNQAAEQRLLRSFRDAICTFPKEYRPPKVRTFSPRRLRFESHEQRVSSIQVALVEFLLLSRCREIASTYWSSFGEIAAVLGGVRHYWITGDTYEENSQAARLAGTLPSTTMELM